MHRASLGPFVNTNSFLAVPLVRNSQCLFPRPEVFCLFIWTLKALWDLPPESPRCARSARFPCHPTSVPDFCLQASFIGSPSSLQPVFLENLFCAGRVVWKAWNPKGLNLPSLLKATLSGEPHLSLPVSCCTYHLRTPKTRLQCGASLWSLFISSRKWALWGQRPCMKNLEQKIGA